ncbi:hypothetical protein EX86_15020, partial [Staphylococcus aureus]
SNNAIVKNKNANAIKSYSKLRIEDIKNTALKLIHSVNIYAIWFLCLSAMAVNIVFSIVFCISMVILGIYV